MIIWTFLDIVTMLLFIGTVCYMRIQPDSQLKTVAVLVIALFYLIAMFAINKVQKLLLKVEEQKHKRFYLVNSKTGEKAQVSESTFYATIQIDKKFSNIVQMRSNHEK